MRDWIGGMKHTVVPEPPAKQPSVGTEWTDALDRSLNVSLAALTGGLSPAALIGAYMDWAVHLLHSPGKRWRIGEQMVKRSTASMRS
jgi:hypothetical protein